MTFYSPLRYPGGKKKLIDFFERIIKKNSLEKDIYIEAYAGGSSIAISLLLNKNVSKVIINDLDKSIYAFWYSVFFKTDKLCDLIMKTPLTIEEWEKQKKIQENKEKVGLLELGFSTFFLNRTNRSGILSAGVIGGLKQEDKWKMSARCNKKDLISKIKDIAKEKDRIEIYNLDAMEFVKTIKKKYKNKKILVYLDPPYYVKGGELYMNHYNEKDHNEVAETMKTFEGISWIMTYDDVGHIRKIYGYCKKKKFSLGYSAGKNKRGNEILIYPKTLSLKIPAKIIT